MLNQWGIVGISAIAQWKEKNCCGAGRHATGPLQNAPCACVCFEILAAGKHSTPKFFFYQPNLLASRGGRARENPMETPRDTGNTGTGGRVLLYLVYAAGFWLLLEEYSYKHTQAHLEAKKKKPRPRCTLLSALYGAVPCSLHVL